MVTEERKQEILENRKTFQRLNGQVIEGILKKETMTVTAKDGQSYDVVIQPLGDIDFAEAASSVGLSLRDLVKREPDVVTDPKGFAKLQFITQLVALALVDDGSQPIQPRMLSRSLSGSEISRIFWRVLEISGLTAKT
jgi:hypothetical protein